jgi:tetratricopeptide (TPR) repeat protein
MRAAPLAAWAPSQERRAERLDALKDRAAALTRAKHYEEALAAYEAVLAQAPDDIGALNECGGLHARLGRPDAALAFYQRAFDRSPKSATLLINKGTALCALTRYHEALASFCAATAIEPDRAEAHYNAGLVRLRLGDFENGWRDYEWRWRKADWADKRRNFAAPLWLGTELVERKTILLHAEQGFGDTIQFARYVPLVARRGATVVLECQPELKSLLRDIGGAAQVIARGEVLPAFDRHCPLLSLPLAFAGEAAPAPAGVPYLRPQPERAAKWRERLPANGRLRVGVCWAGNSAHLNDRNRSIPLERFAALFTVPEVDFVSLQKDVGEAQAAILHERGVVQLGREFADFADTAAVVAMLDLVISVDTSVAHLAGAMGKAVALLLPFAPDWRWMLDRTDTPWYPTARLYRQAVIGDWDGPLARLCQELSDVARRTRAQSI